jgi:predicted membrane protein
MKQTPKVYHVEFSKPVKGKKHHYFGSQAAIYDVFSSEEIGISLDSLRTHIDLSIEPYVNRDKSCTIYLGKMIRKQTNRGKKP